MSTNWLSLLYPKRSLRMRPPTSYRCRSQTISLRSKLKLKLKLKLIYDRQSVGQSVLVSGARPSGTSDQIVLLLKISFRQLRLCYFVAPSLTRGRVCTLLYNCFWAFPEQSPLCRSPVELTAIFYCLICDFPNLEGQVPVFISPRNRPVQLYPRALGSLFIASYDSQETFPMWWDYTQGLWL
jgi:hypothetical protein